MARNPTQAQRFARHVSTINYNIQPPTGTCMDTKQPFSQPDPATGHVTSDFTYITADPATGHVTSDFTYISADPATGHVTSDFTYISARFTASHHLNKVLGQVTDLPHRGSPVPHPAE